MAKYAFADQARAVLEANGVIVLPDGTTTIKQSEDDSSSTVNQSTEVVSDNEITDNPPQEQASNFNQDSSNNEGVPQDERDKILAMQREELADLRAKLSTLSNDNTQSHNTKSSREEELERQLSDLQSKIKDQTEQEQADEFRQMLEQQGFDSENLDDDVLLEIRDRFAKPMANKISQLEERLSQYESKFKEPTSEEKLEQIKKTTNQKLVEAIPDFETIFHSKAFQNKLAEADSRFPTKTFGHALQLAYESGNHDFIIKEVKNFLNGGEAPDISAIADIGATKGVGTSGTQTTEGTQFTYSPEEAVQMLRKYQFGTISRQEYSEYRSKLDAHRSSSNK